MWIWRQARCSCARVKQANALYVVVAGLLRATTIQDDGGDLTLSEFGPGEMAGEMAILAGGGVYSATVSAAEDAVLVRVPREVFERIAKSAPMAVREMAGGIRRRLARDQLAIGLPKLFGPLDETMLQFVEARVEWVRLHAGDMLFAEGDKGEELFFVLGGRLRAVSADGRVLNEMTRGESIGEIALLTGEPRTASVFAVRDSDLVRVSRHGIRRNRRDVSRDHADHRPHCDTATEGEGAARHRRKNGKVHCDTRGGRRECDRGLYRATGEGARTDRPHAAFVDAAARRTAEPSWNRRG